MARDIRDDGAFESKARVMPADAVAPRMVTRIEPVAAEGRQVEAADVGDAVVDDHELLVVAVHRPLARVELHLDTRPRRELVADPANLAAVGMEERQRRSGPDEDAHMNPLCGLREHPAERSASVAHAEPGRDRPSRGVHDRGVEGAGVYAGV